MFWYSKVVTALHVPDRNDVTSDLKRAEVRTRKSDYCDLILRKIPLSQDANRSPRYHFCLLKATGESSILSKK